MKLTVSSVGFLPPLHPRKFFFVGWIFFPREPDGGVSWRCYRQLCHDKEAFRTLKGDLGLRFIFHHTAGRIEAHLFATFLAYCLAIALR